MVGENDGPEKGAPFTATSPASAPGLREPRASRAARRALIIEDNVDASDTLREILEFGAHAVAVAYNGLEGLAQARAFHPDIVLCDIGLPGMDGYEVARELRADPALHRVALVALTGYGDPEDVARAQEAGFDAHIVKPPRIEALLGVIERLTAEPGRAP